MRFHFYEIENGEPNFNPNYALEIVMKLSNAIKTRVSG
jgi:hypothetical protein